LENSLKSSLATGSLSAIQNMSKRLKASTDTVALARHGNTAGLKPYPENPQRNCTSPDLKFQFCFREKAEPGKRL